MAKRQVDKASQTRRRRNAKAKARVSVVRHLLVWQPPEMRSAEDAIRYLGGDFASTCFALSEVMMAGHTPDPTLIHDLGEVADAVAEFLADPKPTRFESEGLECVPELAACVAALQERMREGFCGTDASGAGFDVMRDSIPLFARTLAAASSDLEQEALRKWDKEMKARRAGSEARCEVERLEKGGFAKPAGC